MFKGKTIEFEEKIKELIQENFKIRKDNINITSKYNDLLNLNNSISFKYSKEVTKNDFNKFQMEILQKQIQKLIE